MNRWQGWAQRLRARHGRIAASRASNAMVLLRGRGMSGPALHTHTHSSLHLHSHKTVAPLGMGGMQSAPARPLVIRHAAPAAGAPHYAPPAVGAASRVAHSFALQGKPAAQMAVPARMAVLRTLPPRQTTPVRLEPLHLSVRRSGGAQPIAVRAGAMALRLRGKAVREETRPVAQTVVLAVPRRAAAPQAKSATESADAWAPSNNRVTPAVAVQAAPAINVEALAGMVMERIDRRLVAYRERMGRG